MINNIDYIKNRHSNYKLSYCLVVDLVDKIGNFAESLEEDLDYLIRYKFPQQYNCHIKQVLFNSKGRNISIYFDAPVTTNLPVLVNNFKTTSSKKIRNKFKDDLERLGLKEGLWKRQYYIHTKEAS